MKYFFLIALLTLSATSVRADEIVTTTDGRTIILKADGTYQIEAAGSESWQEYVAVEAPIFRRTERDYSHAIEYMPTFRNLTNKNIVGIEFSTNFKNVFGKSVQKFNGSMEEKIKPGKASKNRLFYVFKDNQFLEGEVYDKLLGLVTEQTGSQEVAVTTIVFEGGEVVKF